MRNSREQGSLTVQVLAGTHVVLLGMDVAEVGRDGLLGFAIERDDRTEHEKHFLPNFLLFEVNDHGEDPDRSSERNPFQAFLWGDYTAKPAHDYTYRVTAMHGQPGDLDPRDRVEVEISTQDVSIGRHSIFFNRGAATSQAYAEKFGNLAPDKVPDRAAYEWLSRGLEEAILEFIAQADGDGWGLRGALYEFTYGPVLDALLAAKARGADVELVVAAPTASDAFPIPPACENADAIEKTVTPNPAGGRIKNLDLHNVVHGRQKTDIPHNKFIVLLKDDKPVQVWTGSTNITAGGIFGHSNVGHAVRDEQIAADYLEFWNALEPDPERADIRSWTIGKSDLPEQKVDAADPLPPPDSISTVFSPRNDTKALQWYAKLMDHARESVFLTAAFGVSDELQRVFGEHKDYLRYLLLDNRDGTVNAVARDIESDPNNLVTAGAYIGEGGTRQGWRQWVIEHVTGLNFHVQFIHTKYMLIDPLGEDPVVITGSANFSAASTDENDENMLVIRGDSDVADVYLGEFMRLFTAFRLRAKANARPSELVANSGSGGPPAAKLYLAADDTWANRFYVEGSPEAQERHLFAGTG
jgi:phosphatidylserine/phosphatidylglycerophosphate/cardiolipin synthase-like enzyme